MWIIAKENDILPKLVAIKFCFAQNNIMISGSKGQKVVRACTIRLLNLGPAKHKKVAIYAVNQRISNV